MNPDEPEVIDVAVGARLGWVPNLDPNGPLGDLLSVHDLEPAPVKMVWRKRFPVGALSVIAGEPGAGKSMVACLIAAELSRARKHVLISNVEDDPESVTVPRLEALQADGHRITLVPPEKYPKLPADFDKLDLWMGGTRAKLVILDPIAAHFRPEGKVYERAALQQLALLAKKHKAAIVGIHHFTKSGSVGGPNGGLVGTARAVYRYGHDPRDEDQTVLSCVKINWSPMASAYPPGLVFTFEPAVFPARRSGKVTAMRLRCIGEANVQATRYRGQTDQEQEAEAHAFLSELLALAPDCALDIAEVVEHGRGVGFSWGALNRASTTLGIEHASARWRLPDDHPLRKGVDGRIER